MPDDPKQANVAVLTTSRSEYYQLRSVLRGLEASPKLALQLMVSGSHLSAQFGDSQRDILDDGYVPCARLPILEDDDSRLGSAVVASRAVEQVAEALDLHQTDLLLLIGDRYETLAAALAATCLGLPITHLCGGERTDGAMDDACRHAITKLSTLHFVSTEVYRQRVIQLGESPDRVFVTGGPLLDQVMATEIIAEDELFEELELPAERPIALICYHPATRERTDDGQICRRILEAAASRCDTLIITAPNHDPGYEQIWEAETQFVESNSGAKLFANLGSRRLLSTMAHADLMIGNSSSGIHETAGFHLPVVNVGSRQAGRLRPANVLDCDIKADSINKTVARALSEEFRLGLADLKNPFGDGRSGSRIVQLIEQFVPFEKHLSDEPFQDGPAVRDALQQWTKTTAK